jgi:hypothetical protein
VHNEELHELYFSPSIINAKSRRIRWAGHVADIRRRRINIGF